MQESVEFVDLLERRRDDCDVAWVSRSVDLTVPHKLPPSSLYSREQIIEAALMNPRVIMMIESLAALRKVKVSSVRNEARVMLEEIASKCHMPTVRWIGLVGTKALKRVLISIRINQRSLLGLKKQMGLGNVQYMYVPCHRSYLDFVLLSYILFSYNMSLPNIASGIDFYHMRIVGELLRKAGAFYMRRSFATDQLYKEVFRAYVNNIVAHSEKAIEFFIEGTRSRSQKSLAPKCGLLSMIMESMLKGDVSDIHFIPISINYDKPLEELLFAYELLGVPKPPESTAGLFKSLYILQKSMAHGHVYFKVAPPISASTFVDAETRRKSTLSPHSKLPSEVVLRLAYAIVDSHKKHTALTAFNLIALLFNERVQSHPHQSYTFETLLTDYQWLKRILNEQLGAVVHPGVLKPGRQVLEEDDKSDISEALSTHHELLAFNSAGELKLMERHKETKLVSTRNVKGHRLDDRTMRLAVPVINLSIYVNPSFAFLTKPALAAVSTTGSDISREHAFERYFLLRGLLSTELAFPPGDETIANDEFEEGFSLLLKEDCIRLEGNSLVAGSNTKLLTLLRNLLLPFLAAVHVACVTLSEWDEKMGDLVDRQVLRETQKRAELSLFDEQGVVRHPYTLSLDLYTSTIVSLVSLGAVVASGRPPVYHPDRVKLAIFITELDKILLNHPPGSYLDVASSLLTETTAIPQAKL